MKSVTSYRGLNEIANAILTAYKPSLKLFKTMKFR